MLKKILLKLLSIIYELRLKMFTSFMIFLNAITSYLIFVVPVILIFLPFGLKINSIPAIKIQKFLSKIKNASTWVDDTPEGWICGRWYIGYIKVTTSNYGDKDKNITLFSTKSMYNNIIQGEAINDNDNDNDTNKKETKFKFWERYGNFHHLSYNSRQYTPELKEIWTSQQIVVEKTMEIYNQNKSAVILLCGPPNIGKSFIPLFFCKELLKKNVKNEVNLVDTWNPTEPGDSFVTLYNKIKPKQNSHLIVVLEEVDGIIMAIHNNTIKIPEHIPIPIQIKNKKDWNQFLDRFDRKIYQNVVVFLTSNQNISFFDNLDPSYMRDNRINFKIDLDKKM